MVVAGLKSTAIALAGAIAVVAAAGAIAVQSRACRGEGIPNAPSTDRRPAPGGEAPVTIERLRGAVLDSIRGAAPTWAFGTERFRLTPGREAVGRDLVKKLLGEDVEVDYIEGRWTLDAPRGKLTLRDVRARERRGRAETTFAIGPAGRLRANLDVAQYNVFDLDKLFGRSGRFVEATADDPVTWSLDWNPVLTEPGHFVVNRERGHLPDPLVKALLGPEAKPVARIEGGWVYDGQRHLRLSSLRAGAARGIEATRLAVEPDEEACCRIGGVAVWPEPAR
jgi:hypothetical protein